MEKPEIIVGDWKVKKIDSLCWQLFELREISKNNNPKAKRAGKKDWMPMPAYYSTLKPAFVKLKELHRERNLGTAELDEAIARIEKSDRAFEKAITKALKESA